MTISMLQLISIMLTAVAMSAGWAHLLELRSKMKLSRDEYLTVQKIYRGWALLGVVVVAALISAGVLSLLQRDSEPAFYLSLVGFSCIALTLVVFYVFILPANKKTRNWTVLPAQWEFLRKRWEYSHATSAILYFIALASLVISLLVDSF